MIDPNLTYRTRDGRPVRLYAVDGETNSPIHGAIWYPDFGWGIDHWDKNGINMGPNELHCCDLIEVTLADELTEQIPWEALRPEIQWVAMDHIGEWRCFSAKPEIQKITGRFGPIFEWKRIGDQRCDGDCISDIVSMPEAERERWRETLCKRPEGK